VLKYTELFPGPEHPVIRCPESQKLAKVCFPEGKSRNRCRY